MLGIGDRVQIRGLADHLRPYHGQDVVIVGAAEDHTAREFTPDGIAFSVRLATGQILTGLLSDELTSHAA